MKKLTCLLACLMLVFTGCKTTSPTTPTVEDHIARANNIAIVAEMAAYAGTTVWLRDHPQDRDKFQLAASSLTLLLGGTNVTAEALADIVRALPVKELRDQDNAALIIGSALVLYDGFARQHVNIDGNLYIRPIAASVQRGIVRALLACEPQSAVPPNFRTAEVKPIDRYRQYTSADGMSVSNIWIAP
jgi:hypothetical protein